MERYVVCEYRRSSDRDEKTLSYEVLPAYCTHGGMVLIFKGECRADICPKSFKTGADTKQEFMIVMQSAGLWDLYCMEFKVRHPTRDIEVFLENTAAVDYLLTFCEWSLTKGGRAYWEPVYEEWLTYLKMRELLTKEM